MPRVARRTRTPRRRRSRVIRRVARRVRRRTLRKQAVTQNSYRRQAVSDPRATARIKVDYEFVFSNYHLDGIPHTNSSLYAVNLLEVLRTSDKFVDMMQNYEQFSILSVKVYNRYYATSGSHLNRASNSKVGYIAGISGKVGIPPDYRAVSVRSRIDPDGPRQLLNQLTRAPTAFTYLYQDIPGSEVLTQTPTAVCSWVNMISTLPNELPSWLTQREGYKLFEEFWTRVGKMAHQIQMPGNSLWTITLPASNKPEIVPPDIPRNFPPYIAIGQSM